MIRIPKLLRVIASFVYLIQLAAILSAQNLQGTRVKPKLDTSVFNRWAQVDNPAISNNGEYVLYTIREHYSLPATLVIQQVKGGWKKEISGAESGIFSDDSKNVICQKAKDTLLIIKLGSNDVKSIPSVNSFRVFKRGNKEWVAYQQTANDRLLILQDLPGEEKILFPGVAEYVLSSSGNVVFYRSISSEGSKINYADLVEGREKCIWQGSPSSNADNLVADLKDGQVVFRVEEKVNNYTENSLWYFKLGSERAVQLITNQSAGIDVNLELDKIQRFSNDGSKLFFFLKEKELKRPKSYPVAVDVWHYADPKLQLQQLNEVNHQNVYEAVLNIEYRKIIRLSQENEGVSIALGDQFDNFAVIVNNKGSSFESYWNHESQPSLIVVSTSSGERKHLLNNFEWASPAKKYLINLDSDIYAFEIATGITRNVTQSLPIPEGDAEFDRPKLLKNKGFIIAGWLPGDEFLLAYDKFDIWKIDPTNKKLPVNITNQYGRRNNIVLRLAEKENAVIDNDKNLILTAYNRINKNNGFYRTGSHEGEDPKLLSMGAYVYNAPGQGDLGGFPPIKARDADVYIVKRSTTTESPNFFWTKDFKTFNPISAVYPEQKYNWLTSDLHSFTTLDGRTEQAVLYKPENFDPKSKYPVIIHYYEKKSDALNKFHKPGGPNGELDIAWFVSQGYLVFTPDIHYAVGEIGQSAYNSIVAAANYLKNYSWVDSGKMGIQGHSFGGFETNYIVTHTTLFAAAVSSSGPTDLISMYNDWAMNGVSQQFQCEVGQLRMGATLWDKPDLYIKNSPIFNAHKVTTPLLTVANKRDRSVPFSQGVELFTALRRLGKKVWMLQYDEGDHGLLGKEYIDYVIRMTQFFDHYLKGKAPAKWMTKGIPAKMKGIDDGLELDGL